MRMHDQTGGTLSNARKTPASSGTASADCTERQTARSPNPQDFFVGKKVDALQGRQAGQAHAQGAGKHTGRWALLGAGPCVVSVQPIH